MCNNNKPPPPQNLILISKLNVYPNTNNTSRFALPSWLRNRFVFLSQRREDKQHPKYAVKTPFPISILLPGLRIKGDITILSRIILKYMAVFIGVRRLIHPHSKDVLKFRSAIYERYCSPPSKYSTQMK